MKRLYVLLWVVSAMTVSCGGGPSSPVQPPPAHDPLYDACVSMTPVDAGNPNQPSLSLLGPRVVNLPVNTLYLDQGAVATDPQEGDITSKLLITGLSQLHNNVVGDYLIRYNVTDSTGLPAPEVVRIVRVTDGSFAAQTARDIGTTGTHMGYYEHLPVHYSDDADQKFPLIVYQHGWSNSRFLDAWHVQAPLSILEQGNGNLVSQIKNGTWDDSRPFIVLSPQRCTDPLVFGFTAAQTRLFIDYAIRAYKVDTSRIYLSGHSQGSGDTWDYVTNYPTQLAAVVPISGGYGTSSGCVLKQTPAWAFNGEDDTTVAYHNQVDTVGSVNACAPTERAKVTILPGVHHNDVEMPVLGLTGLGQGLPQYDIYDQNIYDWMLQHNR